MIDFDGLVDQPFLIRNSTDIKDLAPLLESQENYNFQIWNLSDEKLLHNNFSAMEEKVPINSGQSKVWVMESPADETINFITGNKADSTTWSGFITLADEITDIDSLKIEVGTSSSTGWIRL
ncbi:MAG: hypothetical protein U5K00_07840 [Melioribacteraceae bacterium]|nr:hypothetical protein [Melioribacteraceae bacterium]